jgi:hypothetical protein
MAKNEKEQKDLGPADAIEQFDDRLPSNSDKKTGSERPTSLPSTPKAPPGSAQKSERS